VLDPRGHWTLESWREETDPIVGIRQYAIAELKKVHGHKKVFKMITIGERSTWECMQKVETEVIEVP